MPDNFIARIKKDISAKKRTEKIKQAIEGSDVLSKEEIVKLAEEFKQPVAEYLTLAGYMPDEILRLLEYEGFEELLKSISAFKDPVRIQKVITGLLGEVKGFTE